MNTLDKEEFRIKREEINHLVEQQDYKGAMNVVDSIDWRRVKNVRTLCVVGEIYAANKRYEDSKEIFLLAYHRAPIGKNILYRLIEVSLKMGDIDEAMEFFEEFTEVAPNDNTQYILKYKIYRAKRASLNEQIKILEEYKEKEFTERWSYELAKLYYKAGDKEKCLDLCNEIVLWFSEGKFVMKALDLKMRMGALTGAEKEKYEKQFIPKLITPEEAKALKSNSAGDLDEDSVSDSADLSEEKDEEPEIGSINTKDDTDSENAQSLQEKISRGIRDILGVRKRDESDELQEDDMSMDEEAVQEEMFRNNSADIDYGYVKDLEPESIKQRKQTQSEVDSQEEKDVPEENGEKPDFSATMRMPELKIPESMKNINPKDALVMPEIPVPNLVSGDIDEPVESESGTKSFDFNLEDTILAAATAQGIEIPDESQKIPPVVSKQEEISEPEPEVPAPSIQSDDEILTEEDLQEAEAEFLHGPAAKESFVKEEPAAPVNIEPENPEPVKHVEMEIPPLEPEEMMPQVIPSAKKQEIPDIEEDEFIARLLKEEVAKEAEQAAVPEPDEEPQEEEEPAVQAKPRTEEEELEQFIESIQPKDERDPFSIVPRERELREEEKKLFTYFVKVPGMKEQLIDTLCDAQAAAADKTSKTGNIIVMGGRETGKTRLISGLIPAICKELNLEASKVAYVFAEQINGQDIAKIVDKLAGGFLVIENANQLTQDTAAQLDKAMEFRTDGLTVIIEDEKIGMRKLIARYPKLAKKFTSMINIPVFTNDELVNFAKIYTKENGYTIDQMGMLALYNLIGENQKEDEPMCIGAVKELIDGAIAKSQGGIRKLKRNISKKRMDRDGYIVLYEKDFS